MTAIALTIAGSDSSGGAGIQADLKTFSAFGVYGASVISALTAQNTLGVSGVLATPSAFIASQIDAVSTDLRVSAVKTGMLATRETVLSVCERLRFHRLAPLIVDPVMVATSGDVLLEPDAVDAVRNQLIPLADLITPNLHEASYLLDEPLALTPSEMADQAQRLQNRFGARAVLIKGGHGSGGEAVDVLIADGTVTFLSLTRLDATNTHGTGCTLSAAITALCARGIELPIAVKRAKSYVWHAIAAGQQLRIGHGAGPLDHLYAVRARGLPD
jgi:hydroxymethylpyrimidine/phosphomethylpyrimidine kinase